jgi:4-hydroxy-3-polyprenylbenzoate decarboxylase
MLPESTHHMMVVGVKPVYSNIATQIAQLAFGSKLGPWFHMVIVVDDKTDIYNKDEIIFMLSTRCHPARGIRIFPHAVGTPLNPFADAEERAMNKNGKRLTYLHWFPLSRSTLRRFKRRSWPIGRNMDLRTERKGDG